MKPRVVVLHNLPGEAEEPSDVGVLEATDHVCSALEGCGFAIETLGVDRDNLFGCISALASRRAEMSVFNLCEGLEGRSCFEPVVAGLLELHGIAFTGSASRTLSCALDKGVAKHVLAGEGVATPKGRVYPTVPERHDTELAFPLIVKPLWEDASVGVDSGSHVCDFGELCSRVAFVLESLGQPALAEEYLPGREFNVSLVGSPRDPQVLCVAELVFEGYGPNEPRIVSHDAKWMPGSPEDRRTRPICPAPVDEPLQRRLEAVATASYRALGCRDYARIDMRLDLRGAPHVIDVNPNPDLARGAGFARAAEASGRGYGAVIAEIAEGAWRRR